MEQHEEKEITLKQALLAKFDDDGFEVHNFHHISFSPKRKASLIQVQDLSKKTVLALDNCDITCAGNPTDIIKLCPNLKELDLGNNNISDWQEVFSIISELHQLSILNLSGNPLATDGDNLDKVYTSLEGIHDKPTSLKKLILNNTGVSFALVYSLLQCTCITGVEELFLSLNEYSSIPATEKTFPNIKQLYLNKHCIKEWTEVMQLGKIFPHLEELNMTDSPLENILPDDATDVFPRLNVLRLNKTAISDWESIDALNAFPSLTDVKLVGIPLMEGDSKVKKYKITKKGQLMLARLPNIAKINGAKVGAKEREDAERFFIRHYMDDQNPPRRLQELIQVHGVVCKLADINLDPPKTAKVSIIYEEQSPFIRDINLMQTTKDFKKYLSNELSVPSSKLIVYHNDPELFGMDEMRFLERVLYCYKISDGDEIHIFEKPN
ncbi:hypothetical protein QZH41_013009 [Actinostola sp. cb2023]|nr:hypothetical protein QZH41_013009 [Actinostola sp. cb2023]